MIDVFCGIVEGRPEKTAQHVRVTVLLEVGTLLVEFNIYLYELGTIAVLGIDHDTLRVDEPGVVTPFVVVSSVVIELPSVITDSTLIGSVGKNTR